MKVFGNSCNGIAMAHPHLRVFVKTLKQGILMVKLLQVSTSILTAAGRFNLSAISLRHILCTIANAQDRILATDIGQIYLKGLRIVHAIR